MVVFPQRLPTAEKISCVLERHASRRHVPTVAKTDPFDGKVLEIGAENSSALRVLRDSGEARDPA